MSYDKIFTNNDWLYKLFEQRSNVNGEVSYSEESSGQLSDAVKLFVAVVGYAAAVAAPGLLTVFKYQHGSSWRPVLPLL